ncbi:hypothetical protein TNCV_1955561 [Trichonephila clavipes]|nr:hypothetical protein TNCV_1955561 [Trichonephila clavipes]
MPLIEDLSRNGIEDCFYSPEAQKSNAYLEDRASPRAAENFEQRRQNSTRTGHLHRESRPTGIVASDADSDAVGTGFESRRRHRCL